MSSGSTSRSSSARCRSSAAASTTAVEGVRMELTEIQRQELDQTLWRDLEAFVRIEASSELPLVPSRYEVSFGGERSTLGGLDLGDGLSLSGKIDRVDVETFGARGIVQDYKSGRSAHSAAADHAGAAPPDPALHARAARPRRDRAARRSLPSARRRAQAARAAARERDARSCRASRGTTTSKTTSSGRGSRRRAATRARSRSGFAPATCGTIRATAPARRGAISGRCAG